MAAASEILQAIGSFLLGVGARGGIFLLAAAVIAAPALLLALAWRALDRRRRRELVCEGGIAIRRGAHLAPNHTWLAPGRRGELAVGVDALAQAILPSATAVELPTPGMRVHRGDPICVVRAGRRTVRITAPMNGAVVRVNRRVRRDPDLLKRDPHRAGWLFTLAPASDAHLLFPRDEEALRWLEAEHARLARFIEDELGLAAADGGELLAPAPALLGEAAWARVVAAFLRAA